LREKIWGEALPGPRVVELFYNPTKISFDQKETVAHTSNAAHRTLFAMRATCKHAYNIVSKNYRSIVAHNLSLGKLPKESLILINEEIDTLYLSSYAAQICLQDTVGDDSLAHLTELAKLTKLALPVSGSDGMRFITSWLPELKSLKILVWVDGADDDRYCGSPLHFSETSFPTIEGYPWSNTLFKAEWQRLVTTRQTFNSNLDPRYTTRETLRELVKGVEVGIVEIVREDVPRLLSKEINKVIIEVSGRNLARTKKESMLMRG
jgi:hypothetical protein